MALNPSFFYPAISEIFYFKHDVGASNVIIFIGNPDVGSLSVVSDCHPSSNLKQCRYQATALSRFAAH